jgi:hypothetical protein
MKNILYSLLITSLLLSSCDEEENLKQAGDIEMNFNLKAGTEDLVFEDKTYINAAGNQFSVSSFWMYISNITLIGAEGTVDYILENDYHLIEGSKSISDLVIGLDSVPAGSYNAIRFSIGVDAPTNTDISAIAGELDPARAWNWNTGYKFVSLEGNFFPEGQEARGLIMHIGLDQNYKTLTADFSNNLNINGGMSNIDFSVDILKMFEGVHTIDFSVTNTIKAQPVESGQVADNYAAGMIQLMN